MISKNLHYNKIDTILRFETSKIRCSLPLLNVIGIPLNASNMIEWRSLHPIGDIDLIPVTVVPNTL